MGDKITDKKLSNKKFRKTEEAIIMAFFTSKSLLSVNRIIKIAGVSRSTFYRHHQNVYAVVFDYEKYILKKYTRMTKKFTKKKSAKLRNIYCNMLIYIRAYNKVITFITKYGDPCIFEKLILVIKPILIKSSTIKDDLIFDIYIKEVSGIIEKWVDTDFDKNEIISTVNKIMYLTNVARTHLLPIAKGQA